MNVWLNVNNVSRTFLRKADNQIAVFPFLIAFSLRTVKDAVRYPHRCYWYLITYTELKTRIYVHVKRLYMYLSDLGVTPR